MYVLNIREIRKIHRILEKKTKSPCQLPLQTGSTKASKKSVKVPEVLEKAKKGYHFKAKLLPKRILTLGASQHASTKTYSSTL